MKKSGDTESSAFFERRQRMRLRSNTTASTVNSNAEAVDIFIGVLPVGLRIPLTIRSGEAVSGAHLITVISLMTTLPQTRSMQNTSFTESKSA